MYTIYAVIMETRSGPFYVRSCLNLVYLLLFTVIPSKKGKIKLKQNGKILWKKDDPGAVTVNDNLSVHLFTT